MRVHPLTELSVDALFKPRGIVIEKAQAVAASPSLPTTWDEPGRGQDAADRSRADPVPEVQELWMRRLPHRGFCTRLPGRFGERYRLRDCWRRVAAWQARTRRHGEER